MPSASKRRPAGKPKPWKPKTSKPAPSRIKVQEHRDRLRASGLRPVQLWVSDTRTKAFRTQAHRQSLAVAQSEHAREDQAFIDAASERDG